MFKSEVINSISVLSKNLLESNVIEEIRIFERHIIALYKSVPFNHSDSLSRDMEIETFQQDVNKYIDSNLSTFYLSILSGDFRRILTTISLIAYLK